MIKVKNQKEIKIKVKDGCLIAKVKISSNLVVNTNQYDLLSKKYNYGFLKLNSAKKNKMEFTGPKGISLYERLKKPISEYDFFFIVEQIVDVAQKLEKIGLSRNNLVLNLKYVFFNESTKELSFIYLPIATPHSSIGVLSFVEQVIYSAKPVETDSKYLSNFSCFIKGLNKFDADKVESYMGGLSRGEIASATVIREFEKWFIKELPFELKKIDMNVIGYKWSLLLRSLNISIREYVQKFSERLGTTFTGTLFINNQFVVVHVGDTRLYHIDTSLKQMTNSR